MSLYEFSVREAAPDFAPRRIDLPDLQAAKATAVTLAGELLPVLGERLFEEREWHLDVDDAAGLRLFSLIVLASLSPTLRFR